MAASAGNGERKVILIIADISGYTRFMVANKRSRFHSQVIITQLMDCILKQIEMPLEVAKLEGDAVFLYAVKDDDEASWAVTKQRIGAKLIDFFRIFSAKVVEVAQSQLCRCGSCKNVDKLAIKIVAHSGTASFVEIGRFVELASLDVIIVHRLLKNSLQAAQYLLMTDSAFRDLEFPQQVDCTPGQERYDDLGTIPTQVYHLPNEDRGRAPLASRVGNFVQFGTIGMGFITGLRKLLKYNNLPEG